jgi:hypothetical protein
MAPGEVAKMILLPPATNTYTEKYTHFLDKEKKIPVSHLEDLPCPVCDAGIPCMEKYAIQADLESQVRFPRSKKRRIRNKWAKQPKNFKNIPMQFYVSKEQKEAIDKMFGKTIQELQDRERSRYSTDPRPERFLGRGDAVGVRTDYEASYDSDWERRTFPTG